MEVVSNSNPAFKILRGRKTLVIPKEVLNGGVGGVAEEEEEEEEEEEKKVEEVAHPSIDRARPFGKEKTSRTSRTSRRRQR